MSKRRPDPDRIANELRGASGFFTRADAPAPREVPPPTETAPPVAARTAPAPEPAPPVRPGRPPRRRMIRHPFELYMDQLDRLREAAEEQRRRGGAGSMSRMVRDAIDRYLNEQSPAD